MTSLGGSLVTERFDVDGGREVTVSVPPDPPESVVDAADGGWHTERLARALEASAWRRRDASGRSALNRSVSVWSGSF